MAEDTPTLTPRMKHTMWRAAELARARGHDYLGTEHLILALIEDPHGIAGRAMERLGCANAVRDEVIPDHGKRWLLPPRAASERVGLRWRSRTLSGMVRLSLTQGMRGIHRISPSAHGSTLVDFSLTHGMRDWRQFRGYDAVGAWVTPESGPRAGRTHPARR